VNLVTETEKEHLHFWWQREYLCFINTGRWVIERNGNFVNQGELLIFIYQKNYYILIKEEL
jgi:hypothetical protein